MCPFGKSGMIPIPYRLRSKTAFAAIVRTLQLPVRVGFAAAIAQAVAAFLGLPRRLLMTVGFLDA